MSNQTAGQAKAVASKSIEQSIEDSFKDEEICCSLLQLFNCTKCSEKAITFTPATNLSPGKLVLLRCSNAGRKSECKPWYICVDCKKRVSKRRGKVHCSQSGHQKACKRQQENQTEEEQRACEPIGGELDNAAFALEEEISDGSSAGDMPGEMQVLDVSVDEDTWATSAPPLTVASQKKEKKPWLEEAFEHVPKGHIFDLLSAFGDQLNMRLYFAAEHGRKGGGVQHLATRMFRKTEHVSGEIGRDIATHKEARWHFINFAQCMQSSNKQRKRQAMLADAPAVALDGKFFQVTRSLRCEELDRHCGRSNKNTLWNSLPIPKVTNVDGISCVNPMNLLRFMVAFATEFDNFCCDNGTEHSDQQAIDESAAIYFVAQSKLCQDWLKFVARQHGEEQGEEFRRISMMWCTDWRDGFGVNRTKLQRKSTTAWTISFSTPRMRINGIENTLPVAIGLKKSPNWPKVEHLFQEDMAILTSGNKPLKLCHGGAKKLIPAHCKRLCAMTDRVERGDYASTPSHASPHHRKLGMICGIAPPKIDVSSITERLDGQKSGNKDLELRRHGWSHDASDASVTGGIFPACWGCRQSTVNLLRNVKSIAGSVPNGNCSECADWAMDSSTTGMLKFKSPKSCPKFQLPNCPVEPPEGRQAALEEIEMIPVDFDVMTQAARFAFFNCCERSRTSWNKETCKACLRTCGVNTRQQELVYAAAKEAYESREEVQVDHSDKSQRLGSCRFPAAWFGDVPVRRFVEMLMHVLLLGCAASNFKLANQCLKKAGRRENKFKQLAQELLKALTILNLQWFLVLPFDGVKSKHTTSAWVSENWLAWARLSKIVYAFFALDTCEERCGGNDVMQMIACFNALVARACSKSGTRKQDAVIVDCLVKEFLSAVNELDIRVRGQERNSCASRRGKNVDAEDEAPGATTAEDADPDDGAEGTIVMAAGATVEKEKKGEPWWYESNCMSLTNLPSTIGLLGPLIDFWDGGGKGEKCTQVLKPHIPRGVRDGGRFFQKLHEKALKLEAMASVEGSLTEDVVKTLVGEALASENDEDSIDSDASSDSSADEPDAVIEATAPATVNLLLEEDDVSENGGEGIVEEHEQWSSPMEDEQMSKARTMYICKKVYKKDTVENNLQDAANEVRPISFIIIAGNNGLAEAYGVYKQTGNGASKGRRFGWHKIEFDDANGVQMCGLWYAPLQLMHSSDRPPQSIEKIKQLAKLSAVAIPLRHMLGDDHPNARKCCVITNHWKERTSNGQCHLPNLDFERCESTPSEREEPE